MQQTLPTCSPAEARAAVEHLRRKGWTEEQLAEQILPYMPRVDRWAARRAARGPGPKTVSVPPGVSMTWLDEHLPTMDREQIRLVVEELEGRGWPPTEVAVAVLPHLLPKLPAADADAILAGLRELGMTEEELARLSPSG